MRVVADVEVNKKTGKILVTHLYASQINGLTISPGLVENQMSGNLIQGLSRGLVEELAFDKTRVTSLDWVTYSGTPRRLYRLDPAHRPTVDRPGRACQRPGDRCRRQRLLRRNRCD